MRQDVKPEFLALAQTVDSIPKPSLPEVAFVGRSNVGKSSLINALLGQKIARSSRSPGRTQGLCFFKVKPNLVFVDFPGFGFAKTSKSLREEWGRLAEHYYDRRPTLRGTVWIYDVRRDPDAFDLQMNDWLVSKGKPYILVLGKVDTLGRGEWERRRRAIVEALGLNPSQAILTSTKTKEGIKPLWSEIENKF